MYEGKELVSPGDREWRTKKGNARLTVPEPHQGQAAPVYALAVVNHPALPVGYTDPNLDGARSRVERVEDELDDAGRQRRQDEAAPHLARRACWQDSYPAATAIAAVFVLVPATPHRPEHAALGSSTGCVGRQASTLGQGHVMRQGDLQGYDTRKAGRAGTASIAC